MDATEASPAAMCETEVVGKLAWSESGEPPMKPYRRFMGEVGKYLLPAVVPIAAMVAAFALSEHQAPIPLQASPIPTVTVTAEPPPPSTDELFLREITSSGRWTLDGKGDKDAMISGAHWACNQLATGKTRDQIVQHYDALPPPPGVSESKAHTDDVVFTDTAIRFYCPRNIE